MNAQVYLVKRSLQQRTRNGKRKFRWVLRWQDLENGKWKCENTGTADRTKAEAMQKDKWIELNMLAPPADEPTDNPAASPAAESAIKPADARPTWKECREAVKRAMEADNLRPSYVSDSLLVFDRVQMMFPEATSPADVTRDMANEWKRRRAEEKRGKGDKRVSTSPWTIKGDLATLKAVFGKWLGKECGLLDSNPFADVNAPKCDDPDVRIVSAVESAGLFTWLADRWNNWRLPAVYLEVAALLGWRATEIASLREEDLLADGFVRVVAASSKTRRHKYGWLPLELHADLQACSAGGWAFGRFSDELRRLLLLWRRQPHHAAKVRDFMPERLVGWLQDELQRFNAAQAGKAKKAGSNWDAFTLHDFRRTAITGMQMAGVSEKDASVMVGATPEVIRKHYEKLDQLVIAKRSVELRLAAESGTRAPIQMHPVLRARCARGQNGDIDEGGNGAQTVGA